MLHKQGAIVVSITRFFHDVAQIMTLEGDSNFLVGIYLILRYLFYKQGINLFFDRGIIYPKEAQNRQLPQKH